MRVLIGYWRFTFPPRLRESCALMLLFMLMLAMGVCFVSLKYTHHFSGSSLQAISCAAAYESEWPLLIVCPSSARYHWEHELLKWLDEDSITKKQISVVCKTKQNLNRGVTKVVIISYELVRLIYLLDSN